MLVGLYFQLIKNQGASSAVKNFSSTSDYHYEKNTGDKIIGDKVVKEDGRIIPLELEKIEQDLLVKHEIIKHEEIINEAFKTHVPEEPDDTAPELEHVHLETKHNAGVEEQKTLKADYIKSLKKKHPFKLTDVELLFIRYENNLFRDFLDEDCVGERENRRRQKLQFINDPYYRSKLFRVSDEEENIGNISVHDIFKTGSYKEEAEKFKKNVTERFYDTLPVVGGREYKCLDKGDSTFFDSNFYNLFRWVTKDASLKQRRTVNYYTAERIVHLRIPTYPMTDLPGPLKLPPLGKGGFTAEELFRLRELPYDLQGMGVCDVGYHHGYLERHFDYKDGFKGSAVMILLTTIGMYRRDQLRKSYYHPKVGVNLSHKMLLRQQRKDLDYFFDGEFVGHGKVRPELSKEAFFPRQIQLPDYSFDNIVEPHGDDYDKRMADWEEEKKRYGDELDFVDATDELDESYMHVDKKNPEDRTRAGRFKDGYSKKSKSEYELVDKDLDSYVDVSFHKEYALEKKSHQEFIHTSPEEIDEQILEGKTLFFPEQYREAVKNDLEYYSEQVLGTVDTNLTGFGGTGGKVGGETGDELELMHVDLICKLLANNPSSTKELLEDKPRLLKIKKLIGEELFSEIRNKSGIKESDGNITDN